MPLMLLSRVFFPAGNELDLLRLERTDDSKALIVAAMRLDREAVSRQLLTVKCFKLGTRARINRSYNRLVSGISNMVSLGVLL